MNVKLESPTTNLKLEQDSQLDAPLHSQLDAPLHSQLDAPLRSPASPSQFTYLSGTNSSPKKTCVAEPDKYRSKKRNRKAQMLQATIDCVFGLWEKDM